jgi:hypothetical protein
MFERYTEKARRTIFFARYEASQFLSPYIETEHLLLGLLREDKALTNRFLRSHAAVESIRRQIEGHTMFREKVSTSVDLPLSDECKRVLAYAAEEAERLSHKHIGTEHLLLGLLREEKCFAAAILRERGLALERLREELADSSPDNSSFGRIPKLRQIPLEIHGFAVDGEYILERVRACREFNWYWHKSTWKTRDLAVRKDGQMSFDVSLVADTTNFGLKSGDWKKDRCCICRWELFEAEDQPEHGTGYTNGRDWVCTECYEKFLKGPDFFATAHPEIT